MTPAEALARYGNHEWNCPAQGLPETHIQVNHVECTCGLDAERKRWAGALSIMTTAGHFEVYLALNGLDWLNLRDHGFEPHQRVTLLVVPDP